MYQKLNTIRRTGNQATISKDKIKCYTAYELDDGSKVWRHVETGEQFVRFRINNRYYFVSVFRKGE